MSNPSCSEIVDKDKLFNECIVLFMGTIKRYSKYHLISPESKYHLFHGFADMFCISKNITFFAPEQFEGYRKFIGCY
jgi:hypothetical protein